MTLTSEIQLGKQHKTKVSALTKKLKDHWKKSTQEIIEVGKCLHELKGLLARPQFVSHVYATIGISEKHAMRIIEVYRRFGNTKSKVLLNTKPTILYQLAYSCDDDQVSRLVQGKKIKTASGNKGLAQMKTSDLVKKRRVKKVNFERDLATFFEDFQDDLLDFRRSIQRRKLLEKDALKVTINETITCLEKFNSIL